jgi:predicted O-methyltransferase YrrM
MDNTLKNILIKYNIDGFYHKGGTDKNNGHTYLETYEKLFYPYKNKENNILEVGIQYGGSALLWQEYFINSKIFLIDNQDIMDKNIKQLLDKNRCKIYKRDAYCQNAIDVLQTDNPNKFDIMIDDGPHTLASQMFFIKKYFQLLNDNGIMIIEDVIPQNIRILERQVDIDYKKNIEVVDLRKIRNTLDNILFIIKK